MGIEHYEREMVALVCRVEAIESAVQRLPYGPNTLNEARRDIERLQKVVEQLVQKLDMVDQKLEHHECTMEGLAFELLG